MIVGTGIDICEVGRIRASFERFGQRFRDRIFTPLEIAYVEKKANKFERYAARFAAKEAGMKAIGTGWRRGVTWKDFEVSNARSGKPMLVLRGKAKEFADGLGVDQIDLSLTHTHDQAMAFLILSSSGSKGS